MKFISNIKDIKVEEPSYFCLKPSSSDEDICLWEVGYQYICSIDNNIHLIKNINTNEVFKITDSVYQYLLSVGEDINESY